jgi:hypothetical protein
MSKRRPWLAKFSNSLCAAYAVSCGWLRAILNRPGFRGGSNS